MSHHGEQDTVKQEVYAILRYRLVRNREIARISEYRTFLADAQTNTKYLWLII